MSLTKTQGNIIIILLITLCLLASWHFYPSLKKLFFTKPQKYTISVMQVGGEGSNIVSQEIITGSNADPEPSIYIDKSDYGKYIRLGFNTPGDYMTVRCGDKYMLNQRTGYSHTGHEIVKNVDFYGIRLTEVRNHLSFECVITK